VAISRPNPRHLWPTRKDIDRPLVAGAVLFGLGWGLVGFCPGPALVNLASLSPRVILFGLAMIGGMAVQARWSWRVPTNIAGDGAALARSDG
jgi:hypothetical protein